MIKPRVMACRAVFASAILFGLGSRAITAAELSKYREFQLGSDISTVARQAGTSAAEAKTLHRRPVLIQEIQWRPGKPGAAPVGETAKDVVLTFADGKLFRITVKYDRYDTEGLTTEDLVEAISTTYGAAVTPPPKVKSTQTYYEDEEIVLAQWQDPQYRFELIRTSYGPNFRLVGVEKELDALAQAAIRKALSLDEQEAPQREAARVASDAKAAGVKLDKARAENKPKFRP